LRAAVVELSHFLNVSDGILVGIGGEYAEGDYAGVHPVSY